MDDIDYKREKDQIIFNNMVKSVEDVNLELVDLKETYQKQSDKFIASISSLSHTMNDRLQELWDQCKKFDGITDKHQEELIKLAGGGDELRRRITAAEKAIRDLEKETIRLEYVKTERDLFFETKK